MIENHLIRDDKQTREVSFCLTNHPPVPRKADFCSQSGSLLLCERGEVDRPHVDSSSKGANPRIDSDKQSPLPFTFSSSPLEKETKCTLCLKQIEVGDGDMGTFGSGNRKPFHKHCLKICLPHIGLLEFDSQREMFIKKENEMKDGEGVTYMTQKIVMDGSHRLQVLECMIKNIPLPKDCFDTKRTKRTKVTKVRKEKKEEKVVQI